MCCVQCKFSKVPVLSWNLCQGAQIYLHRSWRLLYVIEQYMWRMLFFSQLLRLTHLSLHCFKAAYFWGGGVQPIFAYKDCTVYKASQTTVGGANSEDLAHPCRRTITGSRAFKACDCGPGPTYRRGECVQYAVIFFRFCLGGGRRREGRRGAASMPARGSGTHTWLYGRFRTELLSASEASYKNRRGSGHMNTPPSAQH